MGRWWGGGEERGYTTNKLCPQDFGPNFTRRQEAVSGFTFGYFENYFSIFFFSSLSIVMPPMSPDTMLFSRMYEWI